MMACCAMAVVGNSLYGAQAKPKAEAYDSDLFNKDKPVWFANAEFLYWLVNEGALDYAVSMNQSTQLSNTCAIGNYKNARFDWSPGLRVSIGYFRAPNYWDAFLQYAYLPGTGTNTSHAPKDANRYLNGTWIEPEISTVSPAPLHKARSHINLQYHLVDFMFSRRFQPNEHLRVNVFGGPTAAFLYQKWNVFYQDTVGFQSQIRNRWQFEGAGLRLGVKFDWYLGCDLYLTGLASNGLLSGWYKNSAFQNTTESANSTKPVFRDAHFHDVRLTYTAQFYVGPSWQKRFTNVRTELFAGYEFTTWTNLHQIYRSSFNAPTAAKETYINDSNMSLQGLTVRLTVDF